MCKYGDLCLYLNSGGLRIVYEYKGVSCVYKIMSFFWSLAVIAVLIGFNFFSFDMMMRMRSDIRAIRKHLLGAGGAANSDSEKKNGGSELSAKSIAAAASKTFNKIITDIRD